MVIYPPSIPRIAFAFSLSLLLHGMATALVFRTPAVSLPAPERITNVDLRFLDPPAPIQIVAPPEAPPTTTTEPETRLRSDQNVVVARQQVRRGDGGGSTVAPNRSSAPPAPPLAKPRKPLQTALGLGESLSRTSESEAATSNAPRPFSRPANSGAVFLGRGGTVDFLPGLPDGDITLLNTKADQYAVFVRRVASQVFGELRSAGWEELRALDIRALTGNSGIRASMTLTGQQREVRIVTSSGSARFDEVVKKAILAGFRDSNPPPQAAVNGEIVFQFQARSWAEFFGASRSGRPLERRWLLLRVGLE